MKTTMRFLLYFLIANCFFLGHFSEAATFNECINIYQSPDGINRVFGLFEGFRAKPRDLRRVDFEKPLDDTDVYLMLNSFRNRIGVQPIEMGIVEILDNAGQILYRGNLTFGLIAQVDMRLAISEAFGAARFLPTATTIRYRHTHPPGLKGHGTSYNSWRFSQADISTTLSFRHQMDSNDHLRHLDLVATIVYIDPQVKSFPTSPEIFQKICKTKAYRLKSLVSK